MKIVSINEEEIAKTPHGVDVKKLITYERASINHIALKPGEALKPHITPVDVCFYIVEGNGYVLVGEEQKDVKKDQLIFSPKDIVHTLGNHKDSGGIFRFLVIKTPTPTKKTKLLVK